MNDVCIYGTAGPVHRTHRVLRSAVDAAEALDDEFVGDVGGDGEPFLVPRFAVRPPDRATRGHVEAMALYAGQSVGAVKAIASASDVVRELAEGAERRLSTVNRTDVQVSVYQS